MNDLSEFQQRAVAVAVKKMLSGPYFSISDFDTLSRVLGREDTTSGKDYYALRGLHCVSWADMGPDLAKLTRETCLSLLGLTTDTIDMADEVVKSAPPAPTDLASKLKLAFWPR